LGELLNRLWPLCETVSRRMKAADLMGGSVTLKLKTEDFRQVTRSRKLGMPAQAADAIFHAVMPLLEREATGTAYRLIGVGCADLTPVHRVDPPDLLDPQRMSHPQKEPHVETAMGTERTKPDDTPVVKGPSFGPSSNPMLPGFDRLHRRKKRK
jgi:DNA polymerase IV